MLGCLSPACLALTVRDNAHDAVPILTVLRKCRLLKDAGIALVLFNIIFHPQFGPLMTCCNEKDGAYHDFKSCVRQSRCQPCS